MLVFVHTVRIEQLPDGETRLMQETHKEGEGRPSPKMERAMGLYYRNFGQFLSQYDLAPTGLSVVATPGKVQLFK